MDFRPGDVQRLDDAVGPHARVAYEDHDRRRHLLRLWLSAHDSSWKPTAVLWTVWLRDL